jgi:hypothetical protein
MRSIICFCAGLIILLLMSSCVRHNQSKCIILNRSDQVLDTVQMIVDGRLLEFRGIAPGSEVDQLYSKKFPGKVMNVVAGLVSMNGRKFITPIITPDSNKAYSEIRLTVIKELESTIILK